MKSKSLKQWLSISIATALTLFLIFLIVQQCDAIKSILEQSHLVEAHDGDGNLFKKPFMFQYITKICEYVILIVVVNIPFIAYFIDNKNNKNTFIISTLTFSLIYFISTLVICINCLVGFNRKDYISLIAMSSILTILSVICLLYYTFNLLRKKKQPELS